MSDRDAANLRAILDAVEHIERYITNIVDADDYYRNSLVFDATLMNFIVIGEMADRLSEELKTHSSNLDWKKIKGFRNLIAHDYLGIDAEEVWQIIHDHLPPLKIQIAGVLESIERENL